MSFLDAITLVDQAIGRPIRHLLRFLNALTGQDNIGIAKGSHIFGVALLITSNLLLAQKTWVTLPTAALWAWSGSQSWRTLDRLADPSRRMIMDQFMIYLRSFYVLLGTGALIAVIFALDASSAFAAIGMFAYGCSYYFIDDTRPKRRSWASKALASLRPSLNGPQPSAA